MSFEMARFKIYKWINNEDLSEVEYSDYWNDEKQERDKAWNVVDDDFEKLEKHLKNLGLEDDLKKGLEILERRFGRKIHGTGIDIAAGNLWAAQHMTGKDVDRLYCLELSQHRLMELGPRVLEHYKVPEDKIVLVLGSFYNLELDDHSLDFVFMSQAFHHAENPDRLLSEVKRTLKSSGGVIIIGEHVINYRARLIRHIIVNSIKGILSFIMPTGLQKRFVGDRIQVKKLFVTPQELYPTDKELGDHFYSLGQYLKMFSERGFSIHHFAGSVRNHQGFVLVPSKRNHHRA